MGWKVFQAAIVIGVMFANIPLGMTDNHMAAAILGITLAAVVTAFTMKLEALWRGRRVRQQSLGDGGIGPRPLRGDLLDTPDAVRSRQKDFR
jgi:hypothetical protein